MVLFGIDNMAKIASCVFACLFPIIVQTAYGVIQGNRRRMILVERMGFNKTQLLFKVVFPQALPYVFVGLRNALSLSLLATIVVEMTMPGRAGLGYSILSAYQVFRIPEMYAYIIVAGILGWVMNKLFVVFERRQLHWVGR
jgi:sulfonate transport system permease protein